MNLEDHIGARGEILFAALITKWCDGEPWFQVIFQGEKAETKDFAVQLIDPTNTAAVFYVQVKATRGGYTGKGARRKLKVSVTKDDVRKLKKIGGPAFVAGIDIENDTGYLLPITRGTRLGINGLPTRTEIDCAAIKALWASVDAFWKSKHMTAGSSPF